ncbi:hypothetical protein [Cyclobacterium jeungdonense]|uniref:Uncharacterized protein n=1 Tax=Cyclobacterium jeungdonense TaxID=708087 RepID=A0ABT8C675_9BACT|nr:hypothetical protein [Cyclobacterium jeungdonense]MDN3688294.1 hypothetical protein [Cyclobacterium jeungdonense]
MYHQPDVDKKPIPVLDNSLKSSNSLSFLRHTRILAGGYILFG